MQELRFVLIVVGVLAIAALLFHGLWSSKKEGKAKFGNKPLGKLDVDQGEADLVEQERNFASDPQDDFEIIRKDRKEPDFGVDNTFDTKIDSDPLLGGIPEEKPFKDEPEELLEFVAEMSPDDKVVAQEPVIQDFQPSIDEAAPSEVETSAQELNVAEESDTAILQEDPKPEAEEPEMQVIVLNVHCAGEEPFVGTQLFDSMQQNGLIYGEMNIFHRHVDLSGNDKVLFSVANMMQPGTLEHSDPADFTTKGISFFMTLPCFGEAEQNFNLMLRTAQQIADDMGGNVLDDHRNLMTPDRLAAYRRQIVEFKAANA
ncbi:Essential cell division protein that stabilizes the FtsZ protofilaments by cross-linking them and that serves as a cytoplasmic membrane anchor for the Z ring. Also required for the recruitment to the septal ring of downstream cell division proteins [Vibrio sp. B1FLJ16]|uniref:cell division protein ZipA n=1 Tax=Vibrio sp. B1FLJ16 TaxID=2751178 RepID=UPI0015F44270|nr:cell division protein ZipA [Vibrio sp. B1FLJ16]CAD7801329.1 Essential cell division protein that stabilizes the FtsZ protofilaments by cross-linking them and that serves as a cytoplasmic membrane anchor for the Z ring. Also required for the recruitment to the septal ring of downstream cell division proteins [Vibrio sp. B1FLJ16]CAE6889856.1 Essential cell division protein that stabilizes the FtsZ protofilaments by cross-linking them and that serves as a cytoplasmic membrane anchor for the Z rin